MICAFTGHRPEKLPWGSNEEDERCAALKIRLEEAVEQAAADGCHTFLCGFARGCDLYFAEAVLRVKRRRPEIRLEAWLPCPEQADRWIAADRLRRDSLLLQCDRVHVTAESYHPGCMLRRNREMADRARILLSVWDGSAGGTAWTVKYAEARGLEIRPLWL